MGFLRSKSKGTGEEVEQKKRNRLSKPLTNKSTTNLRASAKQQLNTLEASKSQSQLDIDSIVQSPTKEESRAKVRSHLFEKDEKSTSPSPKPTPQTVKSGVAHLVAQYECDHPISNPTESSVIEHTRKRPMSAMISTGDKPAFVIANRLSQVVPKGDYRTSPESADSPIEEQMWDQIQARVAVPARKRSNYIPGEATRKIEQETTLPVSSTSNIMDAHIRQAPSSAEDKDDDNISETWTAPVYPNNSRAGTPHSFEQKALGNWSLGSLRITNGRASPDMSEVSMQPKIQQDLSRLRDVSSEYADSEAWEDEDVADDGSDATSTGRKTPTTDLKRNFSFAQGAEERFAATAESMTAEEALAGRPAHSAPRTPEPASVLAEKYMAELPASPFADVVAHSSPASTGSVVHHNLDYGVGGSIYGQNDHQEDRAQPRSRVVSNESNTSSIESQPSTVGSKLSSSGSQYAQDEVFQSALEFQQFQAPQSPERLKPPFMVNDFEASDSGYSSMNSVQSVKTSEERSKMPPSLEAVPEQPKTPAKKESSPRKLGGFLPLRPAMRSRNTAPASTVAAPEVRPETSQSLSSAPMVTDLEAMSPSQTNQSETTPSKQRKKLQKLKPLEKFITKAPPPPAEVIVQRNPSAETYSVPTIPSHTLASLDLRVQQLPELEKTVQNHSKHSSSASTLAVPLDIRFPTPNPEPAEDERQSRKSRDRSKSRPRSKSRRRSMLEFFTGNKDEKCKSNVSYIEPEMNINDLGDVVSALGTNPYDIAIPQHRPRNGSRPGSAAYTPQMWSANPEIQPSRDITPHRLSYAATGQRHMMDDQTASEYARNRSRSIHERDHWNKDPADSYPPTSFRSPPPRRSSFNDRGGIPGKNLRSSSRSSQDAPPMPPMPSPAEIRRMSGRYDDYEVSQKAQPSSPTRWERDTSMDPEDLALTPPPPPPPHSPRPQFLDDKEPDMEEPEDMSLAPPPPCHSPRPMDIEPEHTGVSEDTWAIQARAWRARRQSAGQTLRAKWGSSAQYPEDSYNEDTGAYPSIPPRPRTEYFDGSENWPAPVGRQHEWEDEHHSYPTANHSSSEWADNQYYQDSNRQYDYHDDDEHGYYEDASYPQQEQYMAHAEPSYHEYDDYQNNPYHREPSPAPSRPLPSRPSSRISHLSNNSAISLAEELHPEVNERPSPAPSFGRYSGGLQYSYEGRNKGLGGSSGTRSVSGKADGQWKGMALKQTFGVDLGDVPIMGVVKPLR